MSDTTFAPAPTFQIAPLAPAPLAPQPLASEPTRAVGSDWSAQRISKKADEQEKRKNALKKARAKVESGWERPRHETKAERLARPVPRATRDTTGSETQRRNTLGTVQKAMAATAGAVMDTDISDTGYREVRARLRQLYPGVSLHEMLTEAARLEQALMADPAETYPHLVAAYSRAKPMTGYVAPSNEKGIRESVRRARQDQQDAEELEAWVAKYGRRVPQILAELLQTDLALRHSPAYEAAKLVARHGAPASDAEKAPYVARQAEKLRYANIVRGVQAAIAHGIISGDEADLDLIGDVLKHPKFPWAEHMRRGQHANLYALRHAHEVVQAMRQKQRQSAKGGNRRDPGSLSITGAGGTNRAAPRGSGSVRDAIGRAMT
jgi:hypothetical protein